MTWLGWVIIGVVAFCAIWWYIWMYFHTWSERDGGGPNEEPLWRYLARKARQEGSPEAKSSERDPET